MNIITDASCITVTAKTCRCNERGRMGRIIYQFVDKPHSLCADKKEILLAQLTACQRLLKYADQHDSALIRNEIEEINMALDLLH